MGARTDLSSDETTAAVLEEPDLKAHAAAINVEGESRSYSSSLNGRQAVRRERETASSETYKVCGINSSAPQYANGGNDDVPSRCRTASSSGRR